MTACSLFKKREVPSYFERYFVPKENLGKGKRKSCRGR